MEIASFLKYKFDRIYMIFVARRDVHAFSSYSTNLKQVTGKYTKLCYSKFVQRLKAALVTVAKCCNKQCFLSLAMAHLDCWFETKCMCKLGKKPTFQVVDQQHLRRQRDMRTCVGLSSAMV
jgi:hypothetical protein